MEPAHEPLLEARLSGVVRLPFSALELTAYTNAKMRDNPKVQRQIRANHLQETWNGGGQVAEPALPVVQGDEPLSLTTLRSVANAQGAALDFSHLMDPTDSSLREVRVQAYDLGLIAMVMVDQSVVVHDGAGDPVVGGSEVGFSAWSSWHAAQTTITARRQGVDGSQASAACLADVTRRSIMRATCTSASYRAIGSMLNVSGA